jgi:hypothetical protein
LLAANLLKRKEQERKAREPVADEPLAELTGVNLLIPLTG